MDPTISYEDLAVIRDLWPGSLVVKGVQNVADSRRLIDLGVDGIVLSNHGGRQLDRAPVPFHLLPHVVREVGRDATVMIDTGIMNGADIVASMTPRRQVRPDRSRLPVRAHGRRPRRRRPRSRSCATRSNGP